jgi:hypothetical protein
MGLLVGSTSGGSADRFQDCPRATGHIYAVGPYTLEKDKKKWYGFMIIENYET